MFLLLSGSTPHGPEHRGGYMTSPGLPLAQSQYLTPPATVTDQDVHTVQDRPNKTLLLRPDLFLFYHTELSM